VADRLDATLADLATERTSAASPTSGDELAARRRRRVTAGLVAAASVAVIAVGLGTMADLTGSGSDSAQSGGAVSDTGAAAPEAATREDSDGGADLGTLGAVPDGVLLLAGVRQDIASESLDRDVARVAAQAPAATSRQGVTGDGAGTDDADGPTGGPGEARRRLATLAPCDVPAAAAGDVVAPVRLDGEPATLVLRAGSDGTREAQIYACDDAAALLASTAVPAR
jgi:hypothetical protein